MKTIKRRLLPALVIALLVIPTLVVFAKEIGSLTISGPGIKGELTVDDPGLMMDLEKAGFFDQAILSRSPKGLNMEAGYTVIVSLNLDSRTVPFVEMVYYPTEEGQPAYVHYTGRLQGDTLQPVDEWGLQNRSADTAFREIMIANNVTLQSALSASVKSESPAVSGAEPEVAAVVSPKRVETSFIAFAAAAILLFVCAGLFIRRRSMNTAH